MTISFLMPLYNEERTVAKAIDCILGQSTDHRIEIVVVDDGSTDRSQQVVEARTDDNLRLIRKAHGGEASALNTGLEHCSGDFVAIVEADVELEPEWLEAALAAFEDERVMGAGGLLMTPPEDSWIARIAGYEVERKFAGRPRFTNHITSANAIYRRRVFEDVGTFNEELLNASLDSDFNARIVDRGHLLVYVREARARHHYKATLSMYLRRHYAYARYRVHAARSSLYATDRLLALNVLLAGMLSLSVAIAPLVPGVPLALLAGALVLQTPTAVRLLIEKKDPVLLVYPPVIVLRNIVASVGYAVGLTRMWIGRY